MPNVLVRRLIRLALAATLTIAFADRAAASILLSNLQVQVDDVDMTASITASLEAQGDVSLDALQVSLDQVFDLFTGPTLLDDLPFFLGLPATMTNGEFISDALLFRITGLMAGTAYTGSFAFLQYGLDGSTTPLVSQDLSFSTAAPEPVPEPSTLVLTGFGMAALLRKRLARRRGVKSLIANP